MSEKYKKSCKYLNFLEHFLILDSKVACSVLISAFGSLVCAPVGITSSAVGLTVFAITGRIKRYESIITKKKQQHNKIVLLGKAKLNPIKVPISEALINSDISHDIFPPVNNVFREYSKMKAEVTNPETFAEYTI